MSEPGDATGPQRPIASGPAEPSTAGDPSSGAEASTPADAADDRAARRAALRDLAAMIGVEVFY